MESLLQDLRFSLKTLWKDRTFSAAALLTLALCIGANAAIFSIVHSVILEPLPVVDGERLVHVFNSYPKAGAERGSSSIPDYLDRREQVPAFEEAAIYRATNLTLGEAGAPPERITGLRVSPSYFPLLQTQAAAGRLFLPEEGELGREQVTLLSHGFWQEHFGGRENVVGQELRLSGRTYEVVGVLPEGLFSLEEDVRLYVPLAPTEEERADENRHSNNYRMLARLAPGATVAQAQAQVDALNAAVLDRLPFFKDVLANTGFHTRVEPLGDDLVREVRATLFLLWGGALFVLLIGAVNLTNLALVRASGRSKELCLRAALGARKARVLRLLVVEGLLLGSAGGGLGLALGALSLRALPWLGLDSFPRGGEIALRAPVVALAGSLALLVGLLLGFLPALQLGRRDPYSTLREEGRSGTTSRATHRVRQGLVVAQVAFAFLLLIGAGLLLASFRQLLQVDPGFEARGVMTASYDLPDSRYDGETDVISFHQRLLEKARSLPGVEAAGLTTSVPFGGSFSSSVIFAEGYEREPGESIIAPVSLVVSAGYFEALEIPLVAGRLFDEGDRLGSRRVIVVDERLAERFWPGQDPLGKRMFMPGDSEDLQDPGPVEDRLTVVGVVGDTEIRSRVLDEAGNGTYYRPYSQVSEPGMGLVLGTSAMVPTLDNELRRAVAGLDPELALYRVGPLTNLMDDDLVPRRSPMILALVFAALALLLAAVGLYGTLAYLVSQRRKELGIRLALGSTGPRIRRLVLGEGLTILAAGLGLGFVGALAFGRVLQSQLYGVKALDAGVLTQVALVLVAVSLLACWLPAARASRTDPVRALTMD